MKKVLLFFLLSICFISKTSCSAENDNPLSIGWHYDVYINGDEFTKNIIRIIARNVLFGLSYGLVIQRQGYVSSEETMNLADCIWDADAKLIVDGIFRDYQDGIYKKNDIFSVAVTKRVMKYCSNNTKNQQKK